MSDQEITRLAAEYMQIWSAGQEDLLNQYASSNIEVEYTHFDKVYRGIEDYKQMLVMTHNYFPDMVISVNDVIPAANRATVDWMYSGTHQSGYLFGVEASGQTVRVHGLTVLNFQDGKVIKEKGLVDNLALMMQLGVFS
ncbi:MAG: hypothetical protein BRD50_01410 [Bacteroidetes bacterium SW_11_45_7]|nr:MAG: hypothetical protein BRD50_01410 [Bacteroidetes bacterium SW_11_45_7]